MNPRKASVLIINRVLKGASLSDIMREVSPKIKGNDKALVQAIVYGTIRWYFKIQFILDKLLQKPLKKVHQDVYYLLLTGVYQLMEMRLPPYAVVDETVSSLVSFKKEWAKGLVNAVLRNYLRKKDALDDEVKKDQVAFFSHPQWYIARVKQAWHNWKDILIANNVHPPFSLRINANRMRREDFLKGNKGTIIPETSSGVILAEAKEVMEIPGFSTGNFSVQDGAAQLAVGLLDLKPHQAVLDACAAPGGKTTHILECEPTVQLTAIDENEKRMVRLKANLKRLNLAATCLTQNILTFKPPYLFDRILLDVPCSASGVIRRHPDIKLLRLDSDIAKLAKQQSHLLNAVWKMLKPQGILIYVTCSLFPEENVNILTEFLKRHADAISEKIEASWGVECSYGRQILPGMHNMDGFYYARLRKG